MNPGAETYNALGSLLLGLGGDATTAKINIPISIVNVKDASKSFAATVSMYTSSGNYYPDFLNVEVEGGGLSETHQLGLSASAQELNPNPTYNLGSVNIMLNDSGLVLGLDSDSIDLSTFASAIQDVLTDSE